MEVVDAEFLFRRQRSQAPSRFLVIKPSHLFAVARAELRSHLGEYVLGKLEKLEPVRDVLRASSDPISQRPSGPPPADVDVLMEGHRLLDWIYRFPLKVFN